MFLTKGRMGVSLTTVLTSVMCMLLVMTVMHPLYAQKEAEKPNQLSLEWPDYVQRPKVRLTSSEDKVVLKGISLHGSLLVRMQLGETDGWFLVALASRYTAVDMRIARNMYPALSLPTTAKRTIFRGGAVAGTTLKTEDGRFDIRSQIFPIANLELLTRKFNRRLSGVIGLDVLKQQPFTLDLSNQTLTLYKPGTFKASPDARELSIKVDADRLIMPVEFPGGIKAELMLSSSLSGELSLFKDFTAAHGAALLADRPVITRLNPFVRPAVEEFISILDGVKVFGDTQDSVYVNMLPINDPIQSDFKVDGELGLGMLNRYVIDFDLAQRKMWTMSALPANMQARNDALRDRMQKGLALNRVDRATGETPLITAVRHGDLEEVKVLLQEGADPNVIGNNGLAALHLAVIYPSKAIVDELLKNDADPNLKDSAGNTALMRSADGLPGMLEYIHKNGGSLKTSNNAGMTPLTRAARASNLDAVKYLVAQGVNINRGGVSNESALMYASFNGDLAMARFLIDNKADVNHLSSKFHSALLSACERDHAAIAELLIAKGANVNRAAFGGFTPLYYAVQNGNMQLFQGLVAKGADAKVRDAKLETLLLVAVKSSLRRGEINPVHQQIADQLIKMGVGVDDANDSGQTPLMFAAGNGDIAMVELLFKNGAKVNRVSGNQTTALMVASEFNHPDIVDLFLKKGANVNAKQVDGNSSLHLAAKGNDEVINILLKNGAVLEDLNNKKVTPLYVAAKTGANSTIKLLVKSGANVMVKDERGVSPTMLATRTADLETLKLLATKTQTWFEIDDLLQTPLMIAAAEGDADRVKLMLDLGYVTVAKNKINRPVISYASQSMDSAALKLLLDPATFPKAKNPNAKENEKAPELNLYDDAGLTPLILAITEGNLPAVKMLVEAGADVNFVGRRIAVPAEEQVVNQQGKVVQGAKPAIRVDAYTPLSMAIRNGRAEIVEYLLKQGADVKWRDLDGRTARFQAVNKGDKLIEELIKAAN